MVSRLFYCLFAPREKNIPFYEERSKKAIFYEFFFLNCGIIVLIKLEKQEFCLTEQILNIDRMESAVALFGSFDENIKLIEKEFGVHITCRDSELKIDGEAESVSKSYKVIESLLQFINRGEALSEQNIRYCISLVNEGSEEKASR